jgi:hypothetical protein
MQKLGEYPIAGPWSNPPINQLDAFGVHRLSAEPLGPPLHSLALPSLRYCLVATLHRYTCVDGLFSYVLLELPTDNLPAF